MTKHKKQQPYPIYCINLKSQTERKALIENQANRMNLDITFIEALAPDDAETIEHIKLHDAQKCKTLFKDSITPAEHSCFASHIKALKIFLASDHKQCIILEDNVELFDDFPIFLREFHGDYIQYDILRLETRKPSKIDFPYRKLEHFDLRFTPSGILGTSAQLFTKLGAEKVIKSVNNHYLPYDLHLRYFWRYNLKTLSMKPPVAARAAVPSVIDIMDTQIGGESRLKTNSSNIKWSNRIRQRIAKYQHGIVKYVYPFFWSLKARFSVKD